MYHSLVAPRGPQLGGPEGPVAICTYTYIYIYTHPRREIRNTEERPDPESLILYVSSNSYFRDRFMHFEYLTCHFF